MPGAGILPVAFYQGKLYFLMGKENTMEDTAKGVSDFGGGMHKGENVYESALREASEELSGFLGPPAQIRSHIKKHGGYYKIERPDPNNPNRVGYTVHIAHLDYDPMLPFYYNNNHAFLWKRMNKRMLNASTFFEKIEIQWICEDDLTHRKDYRPFFRETVNCIVDELPKIRAFIRKCRKCRTARNPGKKRNRTVRGG